MNYKVKNLTNTEGNTWTADVYYWEGCECSAKMQKVEFQSEKRPLLRDAVNALKDSKQY